MKLSSILTLVMMNAVISACNPYGTPMVLENVNPSPRFSKWDETKSANGAPKGGFSLGKVNFELGKHSVEKVILPPNAPSISSDYNSDYAGSGVERPGTVKPHNGIDISIPYLYPVLAAADGEVIDAREALHASGHYIIIKHGKDKDGNSYISGYLHNEDLLVVTGQKVKRGQVIANNGETGLWGGYNHLHFRVGLLPKDVPAHKSYLHYSNPHEQWYDGPGVISCFNKNRAYTDNLKFTYPVPCL